MRAAVVQRLGEPPQPTDFGDPSDPADGEVVLDAAGELRFDAERIPLQEVASAWERQRSSPQHKLVIVP